MAEEKQVCPTRPAWLKAMSEVLPPDLYGKLELYITKCLKKE